MKRSYKITLFLAVLCIVCVALVACDNVSDKDVTADVLSLADNCGNLSVTLTKNDKTYFSLVMEEGKETVVNDPYGIGLKVDDYIDFSAKITTTLKAGDLTEEELDYDEKSGKVELSATIKDAQKTLGITASSARIYISGNLSDGTVDEYVVRYTDVNSYTVDIRLY